MGLYLNGIEYDHVIDTDFLDAGSVFTPEWINDGSPDVDPTIWSKQIRHTAYTMRLSDEEKWAIDQLVFAAQKTTLLDDIYMIGGFVWISSISALYEGDINWEKPWKVTIKIYGGERLEGNWSSWSEEWVKDYDFGNTIQGAAFWIEEDKVFVKAVAVSKILKLSDGSLIEDVDSWYGYGEVSKNFDQSVLGSYVVTIASNTEIKILKNGVVVATKTFADGGNMYGLAVSRDGGHILVYRTKATVPTFQKLYYFKGAH